MKRIIFGIMGLTIAIGMVMSYAQKRELRKSSAYIRDRVLLLLGNNHSCSGVEVKAPSGKVYTLTAAHCKVLIEKAHVRARNEQGKEKDLEFIAIDVQHDIMLLEAFDDRSINVADGIKQYEHVHTISHGRGYPSYRDDGEYIGIMDVQMMTPISSDEEMMECTNPSFILMSFDGYACVLKISIMKTTLHAVPGSSGGPAVNDKGELIGIVSSADPEFTNLAKLSDIKEFLKAR